MAPSICIASFGTSVPLAVLNFFESLEKLANGSLVAVGADAAPVVSGLGDDAIERSDNVIHEHVLGKHVFVLALGFSGLAT